MRLNEFITPMPCYYHGTTFADLRLLKRQPSHLTADGVVFAATLPEIAIAMSGHWTDDDFTFGHQTSGSHQDIRLPRYEMRELRPHAFADFFDQTMYLYQVPAKYFVSHPHLQDFEIISHRDVPVHTMTRVDDPLAYLRASPVLRLVPFSDGQKPL